MISYTTGRNKKEVEQEVLCYFLDAYKDVTGKELEIFDITERPDFICIDIDNGSKIGVELVKIRRGHPDVFLWDRIIEKKEFMSINDALEMIQEVSYEKEKKRREPNWKLADVCMLLIELWDIPLAEIWTSITPEMLPDLYSTGFVEIWIADFTGLEAYDNVELFCVYPAQWSGYHLRGFQKPYG